MSEIKLNDTYKVEITEHERGWGSKIDEVKYFDSELSAKSFVSHYNKNNTLDVVPAWYMVARYVGKV
jgi:hypothetical protein